MAWKPQPWRNLMPRQCKSLALKKIKQRNWLRAPPETLDLDCQRRFFTCQVLGPRIFFLNRKSKSAIGVSSDPKPILNPTIVHLLCLGLQYCLWENVAVFGWMDVCVCVWHVVIFGWMVGCLFVCVHACKQFFVLLIIKSLWICKFCSMALGYAYPAYECFKIVERNRPDSEDLRFWCQYWYPPSTHAPDMPAHSFLWFPHIHSLVSISVAAIQEGGRCSTKTLFFSVRTN